MKLYRIDLENFRCFDRVTLELHPNLTVLVGVNGSGKTALLDAARIALWPFVKGFDLGSQTGKSATIQIDDVRLERREHGNMEPCLPSSVTVTGEYPEIPEIPEPFTGLSGLPLSWKQYRERVKSGTNTLGDWATKHLTHVGKILEEQVRKNSEHPPAALPLIAYLGTGRLWYQGRHTSRAADAVLDKSSYSRLAGYLNCLTMTSGFKQFAEWYGWIFRSYREAQIIAQEKSMPLDDHAHRFEHAIRVVKDAVNELISERTGWKDIEYSAQYGQQLVLSHPQHGVLPLELLSDGLRNTIALVADLAFRAYKLNPHLGTDAARKTQGIALIDEVDMFLHPSWQQTVIASLRQAFPEIQFVVTTHSPQVLSTVPAECIRLLQTEFDEATGKTRLTVHPVTSQTEGTASSDVLAEVMGLDPVPDIPIVRDLHRFHALIQQQRHISPDGQELRAKLAAHFGARHPVMLECDRLIRWEDFKHKLPMREK